MVKKADYHSMYKQESILAIITARGGSKRLPGKNTRTLAGKPLLHYAIDAAVVTGIIDRTIVTTDSPAIAACAQKGGAETVKRPKRLSGDKARSVDAVLHVLDTLNKKEKWVPDIIVLIQPTSPFLAAADLKKGIALFVKETCDYVVSTTPSNPYWSFTAGPFMKPVTGWNTVTNVRKQELPATFELNGAFYISTPAAIRKNDALLNRKTLPLVMPKERSIDIDTAADFALAEFLMGRRKK